MIKRKGGRRNEDRTFRVVLLIRKYFIVRGNNSSTGIRPNSHIIKK